MDGGEKRNNQGNMTKRAAAAAGGGGIPSFSTHYCRSPFLVLTHSETFGLASSVCVEDLKDT